MRAYELRRVDMMYLQSYGAWQMGKVQQTDKKGKPVINTFNKLFNYEKILKEMEEETDDKDMEFYKKIAKANRG